MLDSVSAKKRSLTEADYRGRPRSPLGDIANTAHSGLGLFELLKLKLEPRLGPCRTVDELDSRSLDQLNVDPGADDLSQYNAIGLRSGQRGGGGLELLILGLTELRCGLEHELVLEFELKP